jgi:hypothetical protein
MISKIPGQPSQSITPSVHQTAGAEVTQDTPNSWRLEIPAGAKGKYRLAQIDDYTHRSRRQFPWQAPLTMELSARACDNVNPGTWGFGLWNDPFSFSMGFGGGTRHLPTLPNTIWFFFASPQNHLSLRDDLPAEGNLAAIFRSPNLPSFILLPGMIFLPLFFIPPVARLFRRLARNLVKQESVRFNTDLTQWHHYKVAWEAGRVCFSLDGSILLESSLAPRAPLGLVIWIDNQFLAWTANGRFDYGSLENALPAWIEIKDFRLEKL